ncbi:hypothetical protein [Nocardioides alkalitolerans]|uniref:hypothetical protein n=1 Tax=Nocardioides alkalitolerans TaxID=281714 RepID=UPI0006936F58|nr:hypothetical protein [Nocardioides alkalitolerans]
MPLHRRGWFAPVAALVAATVGIAIGALATPSDEVPDPTDSAEYREAASELADSQGEIAQLEASLEDAEGAADDAADELQTAMGDLPEREQALEDGAAWIAERDAALDVAEAEVVSRETAVGVIEETIAANTFSGNGLYIVGDDIQPGTYRTEGGAGCYWERLSGLSGEFDDLIANEFAEGPQAVTISSGDRAFSTQGCAEWTLAN